jgi:hypothetical protein
MCYNRNIAKGANYKRRNKMGNRSNIVIESKSFVSPISLYGHWSGEDNITAVERVLDRTDRIGDPSYLTAQLFHEFSQVLGNYDGKLSFGIDTYGYGSEGCDGGQLIFVNADTGATSETPFYICKVVENSYA